MLYYTLYMRQRDGEREREITAAQAGKRSGDFGARGEVEIFGKITEN